MNPAGQIGAEPAPPGVDLTLSARAQGRLETPEQFGDIVLRALPDGSLVRLRDVARIELGTQVYRQRARFDGRPAVAFGIYQSPDSNALEVATAVRAELERLQGTFPQGMRYEVSLDTTRPITAGIREILQTLVEALVLVTLVVFLFLQTARATLIPLLAVPVSLVGTFIFFPLLGFSINTLSLFGLVLAIGFVVDDAIVVVEAVTHHIEQGMSPRAATEQAMREVTGPVVAIALVLSAVFIPMAFVPGITGRMYQQFALTIALAVILSAFNALSLSPALCARILRPRGQRRRGLRDRFFGRFERGYDTTRSHYGRWVSALVRKAALALVAVLLFSVTGAGLARAVPTSFVPQEDLGYFFVNMTLPDAASLQRTDAFVREVEGVLRGERGIAHVNSVIGYSILAGVVSTNAASMFVALKPWDERGKGETTQDISNRLNQALSQLPEGTAFVVLPPSIPGVGATGGFNFMLQDRAGRDPQYLAAQAERFIAAASKRPELTQVRTQYRASVPQLFIDVDRDQVMKQGASVTDVYQTLQAFLGGVYVNDFSRFGRQWRVYVQAEPRYRASTDGLRQFSVRTQGGQMVPLTGVLRVERSRGPQYTTRFNLFRAAEVTGSAAPGYSSGQAMAALEEVAREVLPADMGYDWSALSYQERTAGGVVTSFLLAIVVVFLILAALYESWSLPWSVLLATPVAAVGAYAGLLARGFASDVFAQVGLVMLVGLTAKNGILIVEFAKLERERGRSLHDAAVSAASLRLRPILMTSLAFIFGCLPLWFASGSGATSRRELGTVVVLGLLLGTVVGVFLVPALYAWVEGAVLRLRGRRRVPPPAEGVTAGGPG